LPTLDEEGNLVAQNVKVEGIASLALSSDEIVRLLNQHFSDAMSRLQYPISSIHLQQGKVVITLK